MHVFYSIFAISSRLVHYGSNPFNSLSILCSKLCWHNFLMPTTMYIITCMGKVLVLNVYHSFEWRHHARSGLPLDDYQHLTS